MKSIFLILLGVLAGCASPGNPFVRAGSFGFDIGGPPGVTSTGAEVPTISTTDTNPPPASTSGGTSGGSSSGSSSGSPVGTPTPAPICDPFGTGGSGTSQNGLLATLTYMNSPPTDTYSLTDFYPTSGKVVQVTNPVYLNSLSKTTASWELGFADSQGNQLKKANGEVLIEYFALFTKARIQLGASDPEGDYQFAIIADDGAVMNVYRNGGTAWEKWLDDDGTHPNKVVCASQTISMRTGDKLPMEVGWFQGPRKHISLVLFWRTGSDLSVSEPYCGQTEDNEFFFKPDPYPDGPWLKTSNFDTFTSHGWKMLSAENYLLPESNPTNPCQ